MKRLLPLLTIALSFSLSQNTFAQTATCQDLTIQLDGTGNYSFTTGSATPQVDVNQPTQVGTFVGSSTWQSFTATTDGVLHSVEINFTSAYTPVSNFVFDILDGEGPAGSLESQVIYNGVTFNTGWNELELDETIDLVSGNQYTIVLYDDNGDPVMLQKNSTGAYAGGISGFSATEDLVFRTNMLQRPDIDNGSTDGAFGLASFNVDVASFDCSNVGPNTVTLTVSNNNGDSSTCTSTVTVEDDENPVAVCATGPPVQVTNSYSEAPGVSLGPDPETLTSVITIADSYNAVDVNVLVDISHTWSEDVILSVEHNGTVVDLISGECVSDDDVVVTFDDEGAPVSCPLNGTFVAIDLLSAFDGMDVNGTWTLTVQDQFFGDGGTFNSWGLDIVEELPGPIVLPLDASGSHLVNLADIDDGSSDNCGVALSVSPVDFDCIEVGPQSVTLTVEDPSGNSSSCVAYVEVVDNTAPTAICQDHTLVLDGSGSATLTVGDVNNGSFDNCAIDTYGLSQTAFNCSNIGTNTVTFTVNDVNGNSSTCDATIMVEDNQTPSITCPANITVCSDDASGAVVTYSAVTGSDNCGGFTINQTDGTGLTSTNVFPIGTTNQEWTIEDVASNTNSCSFTVTVDPTPVADYTASAACEGEATFFTDQSTIDASSSIVSWEWDMGDGSATIGLVDPIHAFADTGIYDVELVVTSAEGCTDTTSQSIQVGSVPVASFTVTNGCEGNATVFTNTSTIDAGTLTYSWDFGDSNTSTDENPSHTYAIDGTYTVTLTVTSDNGCEDSFTGSVEVYDSPTALFSASTECEGLATTFTNLSTGDGTLTYSWDFGDSNSSTDVNPTHTYAAAGTYTVTLTATNDDGCVDVFTASVTVNPLPTADFTFDNVCEGTAADFVNASSAGSYNWDMGDGNSYTLTNVSHTYTTFGFYNVTLTVTDANFCINSVTQTIEIYDLPDFTLTPSDVLCYGESTGTIVATPQGSPTFPWDFSLNNGTPQINDTFLDLPAGSYDVTVTDDNGCEFTVNTVVDQPSDTLGIDVSALVNILCHGENTGSIDVNGTGGTLPYMYSVNAGPQQSTGLFNGLESGFHTVQITDANSCVFDTTITLTEPDTLVLNLVNAEDLLCNGDNSGNLEVIGTGGVSPYEYNLDGGTYDLSNSFIGLAAATYVVGVRDVNGCEDTLHVTLTEPGILMLSLLSSEDANCYGESNGVIEVGAASGTPDYQYSLDGVNYVGSGLFEGLAAGTYTASVLDANGCMDSLTETIFEPSLLTIETSSIPVSCFGESTGQIEIIANGGTPGSVLGYNYSIDGGDNFTANGGLFTGLLSGTYLAVVADTNGCTASEGIEISQPAAAFDLTADVSDALCLDSASGEVELIAAGGTPTYTYSEDNSSYVAGNLFEGFAAGTYVLYGSDVNGCTDSVEVTVGEPATSVSITNILLNNPACPNEASGTASVSVNGGTPGYMYSGDAGNTYQSSSIITGFNGGGHLIFVKDSNGCVDSDTIQLTSPPLLSITIDTIVGVECENDIDGEIHVVGEGGTPSYNYTLNGSMLQSNGDYVGLSDGVYTVEIMDVNGCAYSENFVVDAEQMLPIASFDHTFSGTAVLFTNNSQFGDEYLWEFGDDSTSTDANPVHVYTEDGNYMVTLTVTNSCGSAETTMLVSTTTTGIVDSQNDWSLTLYPNPTNSVINLKSDKTINENVSMEITSASGQVLLVNQISDLNSSEAMRIDVSELAQGIYFLRLSSDNQQTVLRFDIIK